MRAVVTGVNRFVKAHITVHLKFTTTSQPCRERNLYTFNPKGPTSPLQSWDILFFATFVSHHHGEMLESLERSLFRWIMKHLHEGRHTRTPTNPVYPGDVTFGGVRGGKLGNSPFSRLPGWKPQSSNSEMLAGFLLLKLPVATMIYGSVSSPDGTAFPERWIKESRADLQKQATCKGSSKCLASPERTSRSIHFPKGRNRPLQLKVTKPWARRRQLQP